MNLCGLYIFVIFVFADKTKKASESAATPEVPKELPPNPRPPGEMRVLPPQVNIHTCTMSFLSKIPHTRWDQLWQQQAKQRVVLALFCTPVGSILSSQQMWAQSQDRGGSLPVLPSSVFNQKRPTCLVAFKPSPQGIQKLLTQSCWMKRSRTETPKRVDDRKYIISCFCKV